MKARLLKIKKLNWSMKSEKGKKIKKEKKLLRGKAKTWKKLCIQR